MRTMMLAAVLIMTGLMFSPSPAYAQDDAPMIMFVDLDSVFTNYYKTRDAESQLKEQADEIKAERKSLIESLDSLKEQYNNLKNQAQSPALNDEARNAKRAEAEDKLLEVRDAENKVRRMEESGQRRMDEQSRRARTQLIKEINEIVQDHALTRGYHAIIDRSGNSFNGVPTVVFYNPKYDITAEIISVVNAKKK